MNMAFLFQELYRCLVGVQCDDRLSEDGNRSDIT